VLKNEGPPDPVTSIPKLPPGEYELVGLKNNLEAVAPVIQTSPAPLVLSTSNILSGLLVPTPNLLVLMSKNKALLDATPVVS
jgi:hypothetical protein